MKKLLPLIVTISFYFIYSLNPIQAHADYMALKIDGVFIHYYGLQGGSFVPTFIFPKTSDNQPDSVSYKDHFIREFRIDKNAFDEFGIFLQDQKGKWGGCNIGNSSHDVEILRVRWNSSDDSGEYCVESRDAITMFEELKKIAATTTNIEFSLFVGESLDSLVHVQK